MFLDIYTRIQDAGAELRDDRGASAVEYGLLVMMIALVIIASVTLLGTNVGALFQKAADMLK